MNLSDLRDKITGAGKGATDPAESLSELFLDHYPQSSRFAESYRILRTNIQFSFTEKDFRSLLVTSAAEAEGKTSTVANLAYTMAQAGKKVLMVDADLRKPMLSRVISADESPGLTGLLSDAFSADTRSGSLGEFGLSDLIWLLSFQKKTGYLHLTEGDEEIDIYFLKVELVDINWLTRPDEQKLLSLLVKNKVLASEQAEHALTEKERTGQKLGFVLISMGLVEEEDLAGYINLHAVEALRVALQCRSGSFSFKDLPESYFDRPAFSPADLPRLYRQVIIGEEEFSYLQKKIETAIVPSNIENLFILPSGPQPPNPTELLQSDRMSFLLSYLNRRFDRLVLDSPPILPASDGLVLAPQTDGVLLMVKAGYVNRAMAYKAVEQLRMAEANVIGVVLNEVDVQRDAYYKYYHKYYTKYYGDRT